MEIFAFIYNVKYFSSIILHKRGICDERTRRFLLSEMRILCLLSDFAPSQCPRCCHPDVMHMARMYYKEFMDMGCRERDDYLAQEIMKDNPSFLKRINAPHKRFNSREIIAEMNIEIMRLDTENKILSDTVKWMHDTIWEMIREQKGYTDQSAAQIINSLQDDKSTHTDH